MKHLTWTTIASCILLAPPAEGAEQGPATSSWTSIDLGNLEQFATRDATVSAAPSKGPGVIRVAGVEDRPVLFEYPGLGRQECDTCTFAYLEGMTFDNGIIEVDISGERTRADEPEQKGFSGLVFNLDPALTGWEAVYFRPHSAVEPGGDGKSVQYARMPKENWFVLRGGRVAVKDGKLEDVTNHEEVDIEKGSRYEGTARGIEPGKWFTARIVVAGGRVVAFVRPEGAPGFTQVLSVESLNEPAAQGGIGLYAEPRNIVYFRNAKYRRMSADEADSWLDGELR